MANLDKYVNTDERELVSCRPVVARMAKRMEELFSDSDNDKTMDDENVVASFTQLHMHFLGTGEMIVAENLKAALLGLVRVANRAALTALILEEEGLPEKHEYAVGRTSGQAKVVDAGGNKIKPCPED